MTHFRNACGFCIYPVLFSPVWVLDKCCKKLIFQSPSFPFPHPILFFFPLKKKYYGIILHCICFPHPVSLGFHYSLLYIRSATKGSLSRRWYPAFRVIQSTYKSNQAILLVQLFAFQICIRVQVDASLSFLQSCSLGNSTNMSVSEWILVFVLQPSLT